MDASAQAQVNTHNINPNTLLNNIGAEGKPTLTESERRQGHGKGRQNQS